jgi:hypothetical protein
VETGSRDGAHAAGFSGRLITAWTLEEEVVTLRAGGGSRRGMNRVPAILLWALIWLLNVYEFLLTF